MRSTTQLGGEHSDNRLGAKQGGGLVLQSSHTEEIPLQRGFFGGDLGHGGGLLGNQQIVECCYRRSVGGDSSLSDMAERAGRFS